jgi:hypothetical protein
MTAHRTGQRPFGRRFDDSHTLDRALLHPLGRRSLPVSVDEQNRVVSPRDGDRGKIHGRCRLPDPALEIRNDDIHAAIRV